MTKGARAGDELGQNRKCRMKRRYEMLLGGKEREDVVGGDRERVAGSQLV